RIIIKFIGNCSIRITYQRDFGNIKYTSFPFAGQPELSVAAHIPRIEAVGVEREISALSVCTQIQLIYISGKGIYQFTGQILDPVIFVVATGSIILAARPNAQHGNQDECYGL